MRTRQDIAVAAAGAVRASKAPGPALVGFDGYIDVIIRVVGRRGSMADDDFEPIPTIEAFAARCAAAAGKSAGIELHVTEERFGGNGPLLAGGLARLGVNTDYIGGISDGDSEKVHPLFATLADRCREIVCIGPPAHTDALEFDDGKLMLGKPSNMQRITWDLLLERLGADDIVRRFEEASLVGLVNWSQMGGVPGIFEGLIKEVLPKLSSPPGIFIDLADPAKRTDEDIRSVMKTLGRMNEHAPVTLGLNLGESERMDRVLGCESYEKNADLPKPERVRLGAEAIRAATGVDCVVIHPRDGAAAADSAGNAAWFDGPFVREPKLSTGAGDHFNAGFAFGRTVLGLGLEESLAIGCATSGCYVRDAESPNAERLCSMLEAMPEPEGV